MSNVVGSFTKLSDKRRAQDSQVPFVAVGFHTGEKLIKAVQNSSPSSNNSVHVKFKYDENPYLHAYKTYFEVPFKFISILTVAIIFHRCYCLGLRRSSSTGLPILSSTKNLVVLMVFPVAVAIMTMVSFNGMIFLDEGSKGWIFYAAGTMLPASNLSSSILVGRFWRSRTSGVADDPAKTRPVTTLLIIAAGLILDLCFSTFTIFSDQNVRPLISRLSFFVVLGYVLTMGYFFHAGFQVFRSLSFSGRRHNGMAFYLLVVAVFTLIIFTSFVVMVSKELLRGEVFFF